MSFSPEVGVAFYSKILEYLRMYDEYDEYYQSVVQQLKIIEKYKQQSNQDTIQV